MIKYIKILQKEKGEKSTTTSKSPYQVINDMVRNNRKINKQVQGYVSETQGLTLPSLITNQLQLKLNYYCFDWFSNLSFILNNIIYGAQHLKNARPQYLLLRPKTHSIHCQPNRRYRPLQNIAAVVFHPDINPLPQQNFRLLLLSRRYQISYPFEQRLSGYSSTNSS